MRIVHKIHTSISKYLSDGTFSRLQAISPESITTLWDGRKRFGGDFEAGSSRLLAIQSVLEDSGLHAAPLNEGSTPGKTYSVFPRKVYDLSDLDDCPAVAIRSGRETEGAFDCIQEEGESPVEMPYEMIEGGGDESHLEEPISASMVLAGPYMKRLLVTDPVKRAIEAGNFADAGFNDVLPFFQKGKKRNHYDWSSFDDIRWWELASDRRMPPLSTSMHIFARLKKTGPLDRVPPGRDGFWSVEDPEGIPPAEFHYARSDFESMGDFDLAETAEGGGHRRHRMLICSVRFYRHLLDHGFEPGFVPVRLDG